jgi:hypothetical protein
VPRSRSSRNPPFNDSDWFRKDDDVRWQWSEATWTTNGSPKGEHNQAHQFASPKRGNANFASPSLPHSAFRLRTLKCLAPHGMAGFVLVRFWFWVKSRAARALKSLDNSTPVSFPERRRGTVLFGDGSEWH